MPCGRSSLIVGLFGVLASLLLPTSAGHGQPPATRYIEFLVRPSSCVVGHSFVQIGTVTRGGALRADVTIGLYPAAYPRTDRAALVNAPGRIMKTAADRRERATARYLVTVSDTTYAKALDHARRIAKDWRRYDLATENCNKVLFEFADRLGLDVRHDMLDLPANIVRGMVSSNGGRSRASWRPAQPLQ
jgi:hypothetical protein